MKAFLEKPLGKIKKEKITKDMAIGQIIEKYPKSIEIMFKYGLHCIGCHVSAYESIEQGALGHGMDNKTFDKFMKELNDVAFLSKRKSTGKENKMAKK